MLWLLKTQKNLLNEHPKHMLKLMGKKKFTIVRRIFLFTSKPVGLVIICNEVHKMLQT